MKAFETLSFYDVLGVSEDVGEEELKVSTLFNAFCEPAYLTFGVWLKKAYRQKALEHHPDKNLDDAEGARMRFLLVKKAFEVPFNLPQWVVCVANTDHAFHRLSAMITCVLKRSYDPKGSSDHTHCPGRPAWTTAF